MDTQDRIGTRLGNRNGGSSDKQIMQSIILDEVRKKSKNLRTAFMKEMETKLGEVMDGMLDSLEANSKSQSSPSVLSNKEKKNGRITGKFPEKEFKTRPSPLTELLEVPHFKTIHHIFIATLVLFMINIIITDLLETGTVDLGMEGFIFAFGTPQLTISILAIMHLLTTLLVYPTFSFWSNYRQNLKPGFDRLFDYCCLGGYVTFLFGFTYIPALLMWNYPLAPASGAMVTMEQCRLLMKIYAFVRSNAPRALNYRKLKENLEDEIDQDSIKIPSSEISKSDICPCPTYSQYLYFLFAPTLIYRDNYPRTGEIRWSYVSWNLAQVLGCVWYSNFIIGRCVSSYFSKFGHPDHPMNSIQLIHTIFSLMLPGIMILILGFFLLLHAWHNAFAEMLCFGDRLFYSDWWNCSSFASYYKTWNIIVHDWLYTYVFKDAWEFGLGRYHSAIPTLLVFLISSLVHEYILSFTFNFFFPVLLTLFGGFGFALVFIRNRQNAVGNVFMWVGLMAGTGIIFALYGFEYFARRNCPQPSANDISAWDFFQPRALSFSCRAVK